MFNNSKLFKKQYIHKVIVICLIRICSPEKRNEILYQWKDDEVLLNRNKFIGDLYNEFINDPTEHNLLKTIMANYILEGIYFYSGFMFFL